MSAGPDINELKLIFEQMESFRSRQSVLFERQRQLSQNPPSSFQFKMKPSPSSNTTGNETPNQPDEIENYDVISREIHDRDEAWNALAQEMQTLSEDMKNKISKLYIKTAAAKSTDFLSEDSSTTLSSQHP